MAETKINSLRDMKIMASAESKGVQWPTLLFAAGVVAGTVISSVLALNGLIPLWVGGIINTFMMIQGYTYVHECAHKNMNGRIRELRWINDVLGTIGFVFPMHSYTMHTHIHRLHHTYTNDPEREADSFVSNAPSFGSALLRSFVFYFYSTWFAFKTAYLARNPRRFMAKMLVELSIPFGLAALLVFNGYAIEVLLLWFLPSIGTFAGVSLFVDWVPHHFGHADRDPLKNTRVMPGGSGLLGRAFTWIYNGHNYHLVHHLAPSAPWYAQERIYNASKDVLAAAGAEIAPTLGK